jgi:hypothetical protein
MKAMKLLLKYGTLIIMVTHDTALILLGLIDALELFAGIIIFSDSKAEDKIRCINIYEFMIIIVLFDLFDFNEI